MAHCARSETAATPATAATLVKGLVTAVGVVIVGSVETVGSVGTVVSVGAVLNGVMFVFVFVESDLNVNGLVGTLAMRVGMFLGMGGMF